MLLTIKIQKITKGGSMMKEDFCNKIILTANKSILDSSSDTIKRNWRKPVLTEVDYSLTNELGGKGGDGALEAS